MANTKTIGTQIQDSEEVPGPKLSTENRTDLPIFCEMQARYGLSPPTVKTLWSVAKNPSRRDILKLSCFAFELRSYFMKNAEKGFFRDINDHKPIPYRLTETVTEPWHKVFLLVQLDLLNQGWPSKLSASLRKQLYQERRDIYKILNSALRCLANILGERQDGRGVNVALDVLRSIEAGVWEGSGSELVQLEGIGQKRAQKLIDAGVRKISSLAKLEFHHIERLLSRNPPFGHEMLRQLAGFPILSFGLRFIHPRRDGNSPGLLCDDKIETAWTALLSLGFTNKDLPMWNKRSPWTTLVLEGHDGRLVWFWRGSVKRLVDGKDLVVSLQADKSEELKVTFACEGIVGTMIRQTVFVG